MLQTQSQFRIQKEYLSQLLEELVVDCQNTRQERKEISEHYLGLEEEFALLEELELLTVKIRGYTNQITWNGSVENPQDMITDLQRLSVFNVSEFAQFYLEPPSPYPHTKTYIQRLDYLRLLVLEYLETQQNLFVSK
jgi:hypothetical protein